MADLDLELQRIMQILDDNKDKDFVKRILAPEDYPNISWKQDERLEKGQTATHQMSWGQNGPDGEATEFYVYPNITHKDGALDWPDPETAHKNAVDSDERIVFDDKEDAMWFSEAYKRVWPK